jgi:pyruvate/2-oxoglutarate dehydrogenase complex dihydrolipoamide acyltransferase (E2) component
VSSSPTSTTIEVVMPQMGVSVAEGTVAAWLKSAGEEIAADETVCEVTTDKIDVEIPAPAAGVLTRILVEEGETVGVGTVLAEIGSEGPANAERPGVGPMATNAGRSADEATGSVPGRSTDETAGTVPDRSGFHSPIVRRIAAEHGIDLDTVEGTGIGGRIRKRDLLELIAAPADRPLHTESPYREEPATRTPGPGSIDELVGPTSREQLSPMRRAIASHMLASRSTSAHCTTIVEADFSAAAARRAELVGRRDRPTYLAFVARAVVEALERYPVLNASIEGDELVMHEDVNLGIAVALEDGLIVPVIRRAQRLSLEGMAAAIADVAARARAGELAPDDTHGGTFTITNPGQFGALLATPIINQPQVGILDVEAVVQRPVAIEDGAGGHAVAVRPMGYLCMSWDHRALDGAVAARFLADVRARVEGVRS